MTTSTEVRFLKVTLDGQKVIVVMNDYAGDYEGKTVIYKGVPVTLGIQLPIYFDSGTVWTIAQTESKWSTA